MRPGDVEPAAWRMLAFLDWLWEAYAREGRRFGVEYRERAERYEALAVRDIDPGLAREWRWQAAFCRLALGLFVGARAAAVYQCGGRA